MMLIVSWALCGILLCVFGRLYDSNLLLGIGAVMLVMMAMVNG